MKNGYGISLGHGARKYVACQDWIDVQSWFYEYRYKFRKAKNCFNNYWVGMVKNVCELLDHRTVKSGVLSKWFDELSKLTKWYLNDDSDG